MAVTKAKKGTSAGTNKKTSTKTEVRVSNLTIDLQQGTTNTYFASWKFSHKGLKEFSVKWKYKTRNGNWFDGGSSTVASNLRTATYSPPENATVIQVHVKPEPTEKKVKKDKKTVTQKGFKNAAWADFSKVIDLDSVIQVPGVPEVTVKKTTMYMSVNDYHPTTGGYTVSGFDFQVVNDSDQIVANTIHVGYNSAVYTSYQGTFDMSPGSSYRARVRATSGTDASEWSSFSDEVGTVPAKIPGALTISAESDTSLRVSWNGVSNVKNYEVQWVKDNPEYFKTNPDAIQSSRPDEESTETTRIITLENSGGPTYFFRVRGFNDNTSYNNGNGEWSEIGSGVMGTIPQAPTTWSYTSSVKIGDDVVLNWAHNSEDGSKQTAAEVMIAVGEYDPENEPAPIPINDDTSSYIFNTDGIEDNTEVSWKVRTKGARDEFGDWSTVRKFKVYEEPKVSAGIYDDIVWAWDTFNFDTDTIFTAEGYGENLIDSISKYPFVLYMSATPATQKVISFSISITANSSYETIDETGAGKLVLAGDEIYSDVVVPVENEYSKTFRPYDIDLEDGIEYTITIMAAMDSGLSAELSFASSVDWDEEDVYPAVELTVNFDTLACYLRPYCFDGEDEGNEITNVWLSVYRKEYNGSFTEIAKDLDGEDHATVTDPHPSLDYARYRIVGVSKDTGSVGFFDIEPEPILHNTIVIQWNEEWSTFGDEGNILDRVDPPWTGSMLKLPYNIDVAVDSKPDVALVEYIGRRAPVSYYGTQMGETTQWNCEIPKSDIEMLYQVRRLAAYMGDVYVREPSGIGYWANITVSYNIQHSKMTVPVTFSITRVEGGA